MTNPNTQTCAECEETFDSETRGKQYYYMHFCCESCYQAWMSDALGLNGEKVHDFLFEG